MQVCSYAHTVFLTLQAVYTGDPVIPVQYLYSKSIAGLGIIKKIGLSGGAHREPGCSSIESGDNIQIILSFLG